MTRRWLLILLAMWTTPAFAQLDERVWTMEVRGTLGSNRIGGAFTIQDYRTFVEGHYFYAKYLTDIPLTGSMQGEELKLNEPGGGSFHLHLIGDKSAAGQTLTFHNSIGFEGTWTGNGSTFPVKIHFDYRTSGSDSTESYGAINASVYEARVRQCISSVLKGDKNAAATLVSYPLRVNSSTSFFVRSKAELLARWNHVFTPSVMKALSDAIPHEMFMRNDQAMIGDGEVWFDEIGNIKAINQTDALQKHLLRAAAGR